MGPIETIKKNIETWYELIKVPPGIPEHPKNNVSVETIIIFETLRVIDGMGAFVILIRIKIFQTKKLNKAVIRLAMKDNPKQ